MFCYRQLNSPLTLIMYNNHLCLILFSVNKKSSFFLKSRYIIATIDKYNCSFNEFVSKLAVSFPLVTGELPQNMVDIITSVVYKLL